MADDKGAAGTATPNPADVKTTDQAAAAAAAATDTKVETTVDTKVAGAVDARGGQDQVTKPNQETKAPDAQKPVVPDKYDLKLPDGSLLKPETVEKIATFAKEQGLSNVQAQAALVRESAAVTEFHQAQRDNLVKQAETWKGEVQSDKEMGGDNFKGSVETASRFIKQFGSDKLRQELDTSGLGNHPELVRMIVRAAKSIGEDKLFMPGTQSSQGKDLADVFYPQTKEG